MGPIIEKPPGRDDAPTSLGQRLGWFAALWLGSLAATGAIVSLLRALVR